MPNLTPYATFTLVPFAKNAGFTPSQQLNTITELSVTRGSFGAIGHASLTTDIKGLSRTGVFANDFSVNARKGVINTTIYGLAGASNTPTPSYYQTPWFKGVYDSGTFHMESDEFVLSFRDYGAGLQERSVEPNAAAPNLTIQAFVQQLIDDAGLQALYIDKANGQRVGTFFNNQHTFARVKTTVWGVIQRLAKATGNVCYFDEDGLFYFGPRDTTQSLGSTRRQFIFSQTTANSDFINLEVLHQPYKHAAFVVQVSSHDRAQGLGTRQTAKWINSDLGEDLGEGGFISVGGTAPQLTAGTNGLPVYEVAVEGKQQNEVRAQAISEALTIQGQEIVLKGTILGTEVMSVGDPISVIGTGIPFVDGKPFVVTHITNKFTMTDGVLLEFTAWAEALVQV